MTARTTKKLETIKGKDILLDTCIFRYLADKGFRIQLQKYLRTLRANGNNLAVSELSFFEIFRRDLSGIERNFYQRVMYAKGLIQLSLHTDFVSNAAVLCRVFFPASIKKSDHDGKEVMGDMLLAGTVVANTQSVLMTGDRKDFPLPYWKVIGEVFLTKKEGEGWKGVNLYVLEFDREVFKKKSKIAKDGTVSSSTRPDASIHDTRPPEEG